MTAHSDRPRNHLTNETSPYLLQHVYNPVDWHPWNEGALALAKELDRPIFLSIGYSACHWCHVMERESFEDVAIAELMNATCVNIKVDREERPDLDQIYMSAVTAMTGSGGWPMSVFLTPAGEPFFGGTYWPPTARWGRPGFREILHGVADAWANRREAVQNQADELTQAIRSSVHTADEPSPLSDELLERAARSLCRAADRVYGGFGTAPKFPHPMDLQVMLRSWRRTPNDDVRDVIDVTLDRMSRGGIYDHLGGGFARYSTDQYWLAPHFEKMLYDNAQLAGVYLDAGLAFGNDRYLTVVRETLDYVLREMEQPQGGYYSTQDADSEGVEGKFFVWSPEEIVDVLGAEHGQLFCECYDVSAGGNWEHRSILRRLRQPEEDAARWGRTCEELESTLRACRETLRLAREQRIHPARDDKVIASWNGLMLASMARAARALNDDRYRRSAVAAAEFLLTNMRRDDGRLWHVYKDGQARLNAYLDDYAAVADGLIELFQATGAGRYLDAAAKLIDAFLARFPAEEGGAFYYTSIDHEQLIVRQQDVHDNATPSGNGMAATVLVKLAKLTSAPRYVEAAEKLLRALSSTMRRIPSAAGQSLQSLDVWLGPAPVLVLVDGEDRWLGDEAALAVARTGNPRFFWIRRNSTDVAPELLNDMLAGKTALDGQTTLYLCEAGRCLEPVTGSSILAHIAEWNSATSRRQHTRVS